MGAWIDFINRIEINNNNYRSIDINEIVANQKIKYIQISKVIDNDAFVIIDQILGKRKDIIFRIYSLGIDDEVFDLNVLKTMSNLKQLILEAYLVNNQDLLNLNVLCELPLKSLTLNLFDLKDYSFIKGLSKDLEELQILADNMKGSIVFDCCWLLRFSKLKKLYLGKKAKKNIKMITNLTQLKSLSLRGIKLNDLSFLKDLKLECFSLLWCGMNDLSVLKEFQSLKYLELWRILKLDDISFISSLKNLETLKLQDLRHITSLPDLSELKHLKSIYLINMPIDLNSLDEELRKIVKSY